MSKKLPRILAIDPGTRQMGIVVLQGNDLLYYSVKDFKRKRPADELIKATRETLLRLIQDYEPDVLAYEKSFYVQSRNSALLQVQEAEIKRLAEFRGLTVVGYAPSQARKLLCGDGHASKAQIADLLVRRFPELRRHRRRHGYPRYWLHMFDAVAVAAVCAESRGASEGERSPARRAA